MMEAKPISLINPSDNDLLRFAMISELDAITTYEQIIQNTTNNDLKIVMKDIITEEKGHFGELQTLLLSLDPEQETQNVKGNNEVKLLTNTD